MLGIICQPIRMRENTFAQIWNERVQGLLSQKMTATIYLKAFENNI